MDNELKPCPNPECEGHKNPPSYRDSAGRLVPSGHPFVTQRGRGCVYVLCGSCDMGGPSGKDRHDREGARRLWNALPRSHPSAPPEVREALEFYADQANYNLRRGSPEIPLEAAMLDDRGAKARAALDSLGKAGPENGVGESDARMGRHIHHLQAKLRDKRKKIRGLEVGIQRLQEERDALLGTQEDDLAALAEIQNAGPASGVAKEALRFLDELSTYGSPDMGGNHSVCVKTPEFRSARRPHEWWKRLHDVRAALAELEGGR